MIHPKPNKSSGATAHILHDPRVLQSRKADAPSTEDKSRDSFDSTAVRETIASMPFLWWKFAFVLTSSWSLFCCRGLRLSPVLFSKHLEWYTQNPISPVEQPPIFCTIHVSCSLWKLVNPLATRHLGCSSRKWGLRRAKRCAGLREGRYDSYEYGGGAKGLNEARWRGVDWQWPPW